MSKKIIVMIDGGHLRALVRMNPSKTFDPELIESFALSCPTQDEELIRVLYYDCPPYNGQPQLPVSGGKANFTGSDRWLWELAEKPYMAVRAGQLKFRGYALSSVPQPGTALSDSNFKPVFQQKGVDMRIGLDIATYSAYRDIDRIAVVIGDTDLVPAMKHARRAGIQVVLVQVGRHRLADELRRHADFTRSVEIP